MSKIKEELFHQLSNYGWYVSANLKLLDILSVFESIQNNTFNGYYPVNCVNKKIMGF
jgi:hypothetical protein